MGSRTPIDAALARKQLFIRHLAERLRAMEFGATPLKAIAYRLYAKRLREAMAGIPDAQLTALAGAQPTVAEVVANRFFDTHGHLPGGRGKTARAVAEQLLRRMREAAA